MKRRRFSAKGTNPYFQNTGERMRAELGLSQDHLALLLNVSRSAVAMAERGERLLPGAEVSLLDALREAVLPPPPDEPAQLVLDPADRADLDFRCRKLQVEAYPLEQKLERLRIRLAQARRWQQVLPTLRATFPTSNVRAQQWLDMFERHAKGVLSTDSGLPALLRARLAAIAFEMAEITKLLGDEAGPA